MILTLTPNPSVDRTLLVTRLARGAVHRATDDSEEPSGKGVNVSRALVANNVASRAVLPLGGAEGARLAQLLDAEGVAFVPVPIAGAVRVNISLTEPDGVATKINAPGPILSQDECAALTAALIEQISPGDWVVASGSLPRGVPEAYYGELGALARAAGARFALDSSGPALLAGLAGRPEVIKPNADELAEATGLPLRTRADIVTAANRLIEAGAGSVLISLGADGAMLINPAGRWHADSVVKDVVSTIGAGDALLAGFLAGGGDGPSALAEAVAWASAAVGVAGSRVPPVTDAHRSAVRRTADPDLTTALR